MRALYTAATGMMAQQTNIDNIANNLANVSTTGFKRGRANFQDLLYQALSPAGSSSSTQTPTGIQIGYGTRLIAIQKLFTQGALQETGEDTDIAIEGSGFFEISLPDGSLAYTRDGSFKIEGSTGELVTSNGHSLSSPISIPSDKSQTIIDADGTVKVVLDDQTESQIGNIQLYRFQNPAGLKSIGSNLFVETQTSGTPTAGTPGAAGYGTLRGSYLELSNVSVVEELVNMIVSQRAYEINSRAISTADEMMQTAGQLKR